MKKVTRNEASFSDVFDFAKKHFEKEWNYCNKIFFGTEFFRYKEFDEFYLEDLRDELERGRVENKKKEAAKIMIAYMEDNGVSECRIYSN